MQIAMALSLKRQAVQRLLASVTPAGTRIVRGNEASVFAVQQFPPALAGLVEKVRVNGYYRKAEDVFTNPPKQVALPALDEVDPADIQHATRLREAMESFMHNQHNPGVSAREWKERGVDAYRRVFGNTITVRYWEMLFNRIAQRDNGSGNWENLQIYLPEKPKLKPATVEKVVIPEASAVEFKNLGALLAQLRNPLDPSIEDRKAVWAIVFQEYTALIRAGASAKSAARDLRDYLFSHAKFVAPTRHALRMKFDRELVKWTPSNPLSLDDGRKNNGDVAEYPLADIKRVRHSAVLKNGGRIDAAWREEYRQLSEYTRTRHPASIRCPLAFYQHVNRIKVDALLARLQGRRELRKLIGGVKRDAKGIPTMARWAVDDWTSNIEVAFTNRDGTVSLIQPQIITVMDFASRKWVGWSISNDKAPTAELVCAAVLDGFRRHNVPRKLFVENGFVFGKSLNVNGKVDDQGRTVVAGLAQYGCMIHHFDKMSPTSKGELEKSFDLFQRRMERHPGYAGRLQMLDASEDFKREQRLIRSGNVDAKKFRHTFNEFVRVMHHLIEDYNATPQHGHLNGLSPNQAFETLKDPSDPPIKFDNRLYWMLANERYRVTVEAGGVRFRHYGRKIQVRGGELPQHIGEELWALVDREDDSLVTFMSPDYTKTFTVETCLTPSADESRIVTGHSVLGAELKKVGVHMRAVGDELKSLKAEFGNPRQDLLARFRGETTALASVMDNATRATIINSRLESSAAQMEAQRKAITEKRQRNTANKSKARRLGIPAALVEDDDQTRRALELLGETARIESSDKAA